MRVKRVVMSSTFLCRNAICRCCRPTLQHGGGFLCISICSSYHAHVIENINFWRRRALLAQPAADLGDVGGAVIGRDVFNRCAGARLRVAAI